MDKDQPIRSPAQRAMRCRTVLLAFALLGVGASRLDGWPWPDGKVFNSGRHEISMAATRVVTSSTTTSSNPPVASVPAHEATNLPDTAVKSSGSLASPGKLQTVGN